MRREPDHAGIPGFNYTVLASTNLINWIPISTNTGGQDGLFLFNDLSATNYPKRFYCSLAQ